MIRLPKAIVATLLLLGTLTACGDNPSDADAIVVEIDRPSGGTVECALVSGNTRSAGIDCDWERAG